MPSPKPTPTEPEAPPEDTKRIDQSLRKAADALHEADFTTAESAVRQAAAAATMKESRQRVECWSELVTFSKGFADFREQALKSVQTGNEFDVDGKKVAVVEIDDTKFVYRYAGKNFTRPRDRIPGGIVMAIVEAWFDEKPANDLFIGAYHASKAEPDFDKARLAWERAQGRGADASLLLPLLDDPLLQPAAE